MEMEGEGGGGEAGEEVLEMVIGVGGGYKMREELQRMRAGIRTWGFERRLEKRRRSELARCYWEEMRVRVKKGRAISEWERERKRYFEKRGDAIERVEEMRGTDEGFFGEMVRADKELQREERRKRISEARYNRWYKEIKGEGIPGRDILFAILYPL